MKREKRKWKELVYIMTIGGPVAGIAILSIWLSHKLVSQWINQIEGTMRDVARQLGEVAEALRHVNGKAWRDGYNCIRWQSREARASAPGLSAWPGGTPPLPPHARFQSG